MMSHISSTKEKFSLQWLINFAYYTKTRSLPPPNRVAIGHGVGKEYRFARFA